MENRLAAFEPGEALAVVVEDEARGAVDRDRRAIGKGDGAMLAGGGLDRIRPPEQAETLKADRADKRRGDRAAEPDAARGGTAANRLGIQDNPRLLGRDWESTRLNSSH